MIVPLLPLTPSMKTIRKLHPVFVIDGRKYVMATHLMAAVPRAQLGDAKTNLLARHDDIVGGLYMLFQGF
jgi:toxin CcdB